MGLILRPSEIENGIQQVRSDLNRMKDGYLEVVQAAREFSENEILQSASWNRAKEKIKGAHQHIEQGIRTAIGFMEKDLDSLAAGMEGAEDLDEDELLMQIENLTAECEQYEDAIKRYQSMQDAFEPFSLSMAEDQIREYQELLELTREELERIKNKLQLLYDKEEETARLFKEVSALVRAVDSAVNDAEFDIARQVKFFEKKWKIEISEAVRNMKDKEFRMEYYLKSELGIALEAFREMYGEKLVGEIQEYMKDYPVQQITESQRQEINLFILEKCCDCSFVRVEDGKYQLCNVSGKSMYEVPPQEVGTTVMNRAFANKDIKINYIAGYLKENLQIEDLQVAAILGNMYVESKFSPLISQEDDEDLYQPEYINRNIKSIEDDGTGWGLIQWTHWSRKRGLYDYAVSKGDVSYFGDMDTQLEYLVYELKDGMCKKQFSKFIEIQDVDQATIYFRENIEVATAGNDDKRKKAAENIWDDLLEAER
mgnify:CR=1 FL=1